MIPYNDLNNEIELSNLHMEQMAFLKYYAIPTRKSHWYYHLSHEAPYKV